MRSLLVLIALTSLAHARAEKTVPYARDQVWPSALRYLRVDARVKIVEKDADAGYVLFELVDDKQTFKGSLEIVALDPDKDGRKQARFVCHIEGRPAWMETDLLDKLEQKLRAELGSPPPPAPKPKEPPKDPPPKDKDPPKKPDDGPPISDTP